MSCGIKRDRAVRAFGLWRCTLFGALYIEVIGVCWSWTVDPDCGSRETRRRDEKGEIMKYILIGRLAPGVDNARQALKVFQRAGVAPGSEALWAGTDGKTFVNVIDADVPDMTLAATYAPFFEATTIIPVVAVDAAWMQAIEAAQANWS
jgi:hypothetical protein